jgi:hypothetical protein
MSDNFRYKLGVIETDGREYPIQRTLNEVLKKEYTEERYQCLTELIIAVLHDSKHEYAAKCIDGIDFGGVKFSSIETMISYLLFERAVTSCNLAMSDGDTGRIIDSFADFNFAIFLSISREMLGLCSIYRAFFLPKNENEDVSKNAFVLNELNIARQIIDNESKVYRRFVGDYEFYRLIPDVYYYFISDDIENNYRYTYVYNVCSLKEFLPTKSKSPREYLASEKILNGNIVKRLESQDYVLLTGFELDKDIFELRGGSARPE